MVDSNNNKPISPSSPISSPTAEEGFSYDQKTDLQTEQVASVPFGCFSVKVIDCEKKIPLSKNSKISSRSLASRKVAQLADKDRICTIKQRQGGINGIVTEVDPHQLDEKDPVIVSYMSKGPKKKLNHQARHIKNDQDVACRHIVYGFVNYDFGTKGTEKFLRIDTAEKLGKHSGILTDGELNKVFNDRVSREGYYFNENSFGQAVHECMEHQKNRGVTSQRYVLSSTIHAMGLELTRSEQEDVVKLAFFDPNDTLRVRRFIVSPASFLSTLSVQDLLSDEYRKLYFQEDMPAGCLISPDVKSLSEQSASHVKVAGSLSPVTVHLLLGKGHFNADHVTELQERKDLHVLLEAKNMNGYPGLFMAMQRNHKDAVQCYFDTVLNAPFSENIKKNLVAGKNKNDFPALHMAFRKGNTKSVEAYVKAVLSSDLKETTKVYLLSAVSKSGNSGLLTALQQNNAETAKLFIQLIASSKLQEKNKKQLLSAVLKNGRSFLDLALLKGDVEAAKSYLEPVLSSDVSNTMKSELLSGTQRKTEPAFFSVLANGDVDTVNAYFPLIAESRLDRDTRVKLLLAENQRGMSGISASLVNSQFIATSHYTKQVLSSKHLDHEAKMQLLKVVDAQGNTTLFTVLQNNDEDTLRAYLEPILKDVDLSDDDKYALLNTVNAKGEKGFLLAEQKGCTGVCQLYKQLITRSVLNDEIKNKLLGSADD